MSSSRFLFFFFSTIFVQLVALTIAQQNSLLGTICIYTSNFTANSAYKTNLDQLLSSISKTQNNYGFYNASFGKNADQVNAIALCRGDVKPDTCQSCIQNSTVAITKACPNQKEAYVWYDDCMLRYSNRSIFDSMEFGPYFYMWNLNNVSDASQFNQGVTTLLDKLASQAASGDSRLKFATGNTTTTSNESIYALVQCTPDLSKQECNTCLSNATQLLPTCCDGKQGGRVISPSCNFRYEKGIFYDTSAVILAPSPAPLPQSPLSTPPPQVTPASPPSTRRATPPSSTQPIPSGPNTEATTPTSPGPGGPATVTPGKASQIASTVITSVFAIVAYVILVKSA